MQDLFNFENVYLFALQVGLTLVSLLIISYVTCWIGQRVWAWLDDEKVGPENLLLNLVRKGTPYKYPVTDFDGEKNYYYSDNKVDEGKTRSKDKMVGRIVRANSTERNYCPDPLILFLCSVASIFGPLSLALIYSFLHLSLCIAGFFAVAFLTRAGRRGQKLLKSHIEDKKLHSSE